MIGQEVFEAKCQTKLEEAKENLERLGRRLVLMIANYPALCVFCSLMFYCVTLFQCTL